MTLWTLTVPLLPVGENLTTTLGPIVPILGIDVEGRTIAVLFDLRNDRPLTTILGESVLVLQWAESLDEKQLEVISRYFWREPKASLAAVWAQVHGVQERTVSFGHQTQVHILSWRPTTVLGGIQFFLHRYRLSISFFRLHTLQGEKGETIAIADPIVSTLVTEGVTLETPSMRKVGEIEAFLKFIEAKGNH